jgi:hypothetical protein
VVSGLLDLCKQAARPARWRVDYREASPQVAEGYHKLLGRIWNLRVISLQALGLTFKLCVVAGR